MSFIPTDEQARILGHNSQNHARILAGPGTGKSTTVVALIAQLQRSQPQPTTRMLTFTRAATSELASKLSDDAETSHLTPGTVHSFAIRTLMVNPGLGTFPEPLRIADDWENDNIVLPTLANILGCDKRETIEYIKEMATGWEALEDAPITEHSPQQRSRFLGIWEEHRQRFGYTLLAELPYRLRNALRGGSDLSGINLDLLIVDEYQDLNACDLDLIHGIAERTGCRVLGIGDDDQSIYSFRSAAPSGIRRFLHDYQGALDYPLLQSLRCGRRIIEWANHVIRQNTDRPAERPDLRAGAGNPLGEARLLAFRGNVAEAKGIADLVKRLIDQEHVDPKDILILLRSDHQGVFSKPIKEQLAARAIPFSDASWVVELLAEDANRLFLARLRLLSDPSDSLAWATILLLTPNIAESFISHVHEHARSSNANFSSALTDLRQANFPAAAARSRNAANATIDEVQRWLAANRLPETPTTWSDWIFALPVPAGSSAPTEAFVQLVRDVEQLSEDDVTLPRLLNQLTPVGKDVAASRASGVRIMSMASSKGLTVRATIIAGCEDGIVPHPQRDRSEEARLLYVAMTRSKEFLYCTWAQRRKGPTARAGRGVVRDARRHSGFFDAGPIRSESGESFLAGI